MSNTVITNYTDLNGPSTKADNSVVVIVNKDGSLSVDQKLLGTLMGSDGSQAAGISVVRVGHEGRPDDATDSENEDDKVPHVTLSVDSYYDEPDSIIKYDSGAEMLQSLRIETRENSLIGFQNDHCYTLLTSPSQTLPQKCESFTTYDDPIIEITHHPPPKPVTTPKKIAILDQKIFPKGKKIILTPAEPSVILKGIDTLNKPLPVLSKSLSNVEKNVDHAKLEEQSESSSVTSSSGDSAADRDSDSDYKDSKDRSVPQKFRKLKTKPRILKNVQLAKASKLDPKTASRLKAGKNILRKEIKERVLGKNIILAKKKTETEIPIVKETLPSTPTTQNLQTSVGTELSKVTPKSVPKINKKEKKTPAHVSALLSDMTSLFSTPDVIRRVSTENKTPLKEPSPVAKKQLELKLIETNNDRAMEVANALESMESKTSVSSKPFVKRITNITEKVKAYDPIPQLDDASLAQILQDTTPNKVNPSISAANVINSPGLAGPLSPTLDLLAGLQPEEDGLTEDLLMHVAQLVESSENLQEVLDKQVLGKVDAIPTKIAQQPHTFAQPQIQSPTQPQVHSQLHMQAQGIYTQNSLKAKTLIPRKDPIEIVRRDGRVITLPPIEAPATRSSKRKSQVETHIIPEIPPAPPVEEVAVTPEPVLQHVSKQYTNKKLPKKVEPIIEPPIIEKSAESQESWNSEDDPNRLWCICKQPHNNRFMICCDGCEDWFHGKCVNITKAMGQQMEDQGIEWRCPKCVKKLPKSAIKMPAVQKTPEASPHPAASRETGKTGCIVCGRATRASSIYCSDACILKHAQDSLGTKSEAVPGRSADKVSESRVIVYERKSGRLLAGPNAPTAENLKTWLQKNPTFEVVRPGTLSAIKPNAIRKKSLDSSPKIQTTLNFAKIPRKSMEQSPMKSQNLAHTDNSHLEHKQPEKEKLTKSLLSPREHTKPAFPSRGTPKLTTPREEFKPTPQPKTPTTPKVIQNLPETPKSSLNKSSNESRKNRALIRAQSSAEKVSAVPQPTSRRKDSQDKKKMDSEEEIRDNVRKSLQEQISLRMVENEGSKLSEDEIQQYAVDTESELFDLFNHDVGMKYKAKYRSLMFNIKDRKNLSLWKKICERKLKPSELVRLSPEELASQELAQWREEESKHQLELIKKSEIDLLAASKTYVLKTHKGEEVMETKESVSTELDPNLPVEDLVTALNDAVGDGLTPPAGNQDTSKSKDTIKSKSSNGRKKDKEKKSSHSKKDRETRRDSEKRKSRSSRSEVEKEHRSTRRSKRSARSSRSDSKERKLEKEKSDSERSRQRSRSRGKSKRRSRDRSRSESRGRDRDRARRSESRETSRRRRSRSTRKSIAEDKHRSRSHENVKNKNDSTDSESIERPKSAMMKEVHPEYDPHEPMITSAFSEEDLHKSREDIDEDTYKISEYGNVDVDSMKSFAVDTDIPLPTTVYKDKASVEVESDQEPSSTVENSAATVWNGCINMVDVARFYVAAHEVSGNALELEEDLAAELDVVGRINPDTVWDYIGKMKRASNKDIVLLRLQAANDEERMQYIALYSYLSTRNRLGVVKVTNTATVKDFYILPLSANTPLPPALLPPDGPGLGEARTHLLIAIIIRQRRKRPPPLAVRDTVPAKVARESRKKSYTPPLSPRNRSLNLPPYTSSALSSTVKDKIAASLAADDDEPYSPGSSNSSNGAPPAGLPTHNLRNKMEELNRQIEEQKQQIFKMAQADSSVPSADNEAYSPSRPLSPAPRGVPLADISLPSNLQEILATIKQRSETAADVDMRTMPLP